jgi:predicted kinase
MTIPPGVISRETSGAPHERSVTLAQIPFSMDQEQGRRGTPAWRPGLWVLVGLPGSGKTTFSKKIWEQNPTRTLRVCLDDIIQMMSFYSYDRALRYFYGETERRPIVSGLVQGLCVIIDRTNLNRAVRSQFLALKQQVEQAAAGVEREFLRVEGDLEVLAHRIRAHLWQLFPAAETQDEPPDEVLSYEAFLRLLRSSYLPARELSLFGGTPAPHPSFEQHLRDLGRVGATAVYLDVPRDLALARRREDPFLPLREVHRRHDWAEVLTRMERELETPAVNEGFDAVLRVDEGGRVVGEERESR